MYIQQRQVVPKYNHTINHNLGQSKMDQMDILFLALIFMLTFFVISCYCLCLITLFSTDEGESDGPISNETTIKNILLSDTCNITYASKVDMSWVWLIWMANGGQHIFDLGECYVKSYCFLLCFMLKYL